MQTTDQLAGLIVREQAAIIGPLAWAEARRVQGLKVDRQKREVHVEGVPREVLERLVRQYERLFGRASREVCRDAVRPLVAHVPQEEIPAVLR